MVVTFSAGDSARFRHGAENMHFRQAGVFHSSKPSTDSAIPAALVGRGTEVLAKKIDRQLELGASGRAATTTPVRSDPLLFEGEMNNGEFIVSFESFEITTGDNAGRWHSRFSIRRSDRVIYYGSGKGFALSRVEAENAAAREACRVLSAGAQLLY